MGGWDGADRGGLKGEACRIKLQLHLQEKEVERMKMKRDEGGCELSPTDTSSLMWTPSSTGVLEDKHGCSFNIIHLLS